MNIKNVEIEASLNEIDNDNIIRNMVKEKIESGVLGVTYKVQEIDLENLRFTFTGIPVNNGIKTYDEVVRPKNKMRQVTLDGVRVEKSNHVYRKLTKIYSGPHYTVYKEICRIAATNLSNKQKIRAVRTLLKLNGAKRVVLSSIRAHLNYSTKFIRANSGWESMPGLPNTRVTTDLSKLTPINKFRKVTIYKEIVDLLKNAPPNLNISEYDKLVREYMKSIGSNITTPNQLIGLTYFHRLYLNG
jgi:hypothetical protein